MPQMSDIELKAIVASEISDSIGYLTDEVRSEQEEALKRYRGDAYGNERDGHSKVVSRDGMDAVEWTIPYFMKTFHGTQRPVEFEPVGLEDTENSRLVTDYIRHVYMVDNPGYRITHNVTKDGLIQKVGIWKIWSEESEFPETSTHTGLTDLEAAELVQEGEVVESDNEDGFWSIKLRRTEKRRRTRVEAVPPEEFLISRRMKWLPNHQNPGFCGHRYQKTRSQLISEGFDRKMVENLPADNAEADDTNTETRYPDESPSSSTGGDRASDKITMIECYLHVDYDDDGIAELRYVLMAGGQNGELVLNEEIDDHPFEAWCPIPMSHKFYGRSLMDSVMDKQEIKTTLWRQMLDNLYLTNEPRKKCIKGEYDSDQLSASVIGGQYDVERPESVTNDVTPFVAAESFPMLEYIDQRLEGETGTGGRTQGLSEDLLKTHQVRGNVEQVISMAQQRQELMARNFAELGFGPLFRKMLRLEIKYSDKPRQIRLNNELIEVDPRQWNAEMDFKVNVGLGTGNRDQEISSLVSILTVQERMMEKLGPGLVTENRIYDTARELTELIGRPSPAPYFNAPESESYQEAKQLTAENQKPSEQEVFGQVEAAKLQQREQESQRESALKAREQNLRAFVELQKAGITLNVAQIKAVTEGDKMLIDLEKNAQVQ